MSRFEIVDSFSKKGYNCAQAVSCAYADLTSISHSDMFKLTECLGGGIGRMQNICGALLGTLLISGYFNSDGGLENGKTKAQTCAKAKELNYKFVEKMGSSQCIELLRGEAPKPGRCNDELRAACEVLEDFLTEMQIKY